jgi:Leucine-rich repeat (LRR) protein
MGGVLTRKIEEAKNNGGLEFLLEDEDLADYDLISLFRRISKDLPRLTRIKLLKCKINSISSAAIRTIEPNRLDQLHLDENHLTSLPSQFFRLVFLQDLSLAKNHFAEIPEVVFALPVLTRLSVAGNLLSTIRPTISRLTALACLDVSGNCLATLPQEVSTLRGLSQLDLSRNAISTLPAALLRLTGLKLLDISQNRISSLPDDLCRLTCLQTLNVNGNLLEQLPSAIGRMRLVLLLLSHNRITSLPDTLVCFHTFRHLFMLILFIIYVLSSEISQGELTQLRELHVSNNCLASLPSSIGQLVYLMQLHAGVSFFFFWNCALSLPLSRRYSFYCSQQPTRVCS